MKLQSWSLASLLLLVTLSAGAQTLYVADMANKRIQTHDASSGAAINLSFITGLNNPWGIAVAGDLLFVSDLDGTDDVGAYDATTGVYLFDLAGTAGSIDVAVSGNTVYVLVYSSGKVMTFDATTGAVISPSFITGNLAGGQGIAVAGGNLYGAMNGDLAIRLWDTWTGVLLNSTFATTLACPEDVDVSGDTLYVTAGGSGSGEGGLNRKVETFNATTGDLINNNFVSQNGTSYVVARDGVLYVSGAASGTGVRAYDATTGAALPGFTPIAGSFRGVALSAVPEPATAGLLVLASALAFRCCSSFIAGVQNS